MPKPITRPHVAPFSCWKYTIQFPESINSYWRSRIVGSGKRAHAMYYVSNDGMKFQKAVAAAVRFKPHTRRRLYVKIELQRQDNKEYDIDNFVKSTQDALATVGVYENDKQIDHLEVVRLPVQAPGCCIVTVKEIGYAKPIIKA